MLYINSEVHLLVLHRIRLDELPILSLGCYPRILGNFWRNKPKLDQPSFYKNLAQISVDLGIIFSIVGEIHCYCQNLL